MDKHGKGELYRRLDHTRRVLSRPLDPLTSERLEELARSIEQQLAVTGKFECLKCKEGTVSEG